jgi:hypothetical protein
LDFEENEGLKNKDQHERSTKLKRLAAEREINPDDDFIEKVKARLEKN